MSDRYDNYSDSMLILAISDLKKEKDAISSQLKEAENILLNRKRDEINLSLQQKTEPFGAVSQVIGGIKVTFTIPKKVVYSQSGLADLYSQIKGDPNENVDDYISIEYSVKESAYKNWPSNIQAAFRPFRTVTPGNISIKIQEEEKA